MYVIDALLTPLSLPMLSQSNLRLANSQDTDYYRGPRIDSSSLNLTRPSTSSFPSRPARHSKSMQNLSLSVVSFLFPKSPGQPKHGTAASVGGDRIFVHPSRVENDSPPPGCLTKSRHRPTRSTASSLETDQSPRIEPRRTRRANKLESMLYSDEELREGSPFPVLDISGRDSLYYNDDACSPVSSIHFADDPDDKPPNDSSKRNSISPVEDDEVSTPRVLHYSFGSVLDISAANRVLDPEEEAEEELDDDFSLDRKIGQGSIMIKPPTPSSRRSSVSTVVGSSGVDAGWLLPEVPTLSPISASFGLPPDLAENEPAKRKRRSSVFQSVDSLATFLRPARASRPRNSLFRPSSVPYAAVFSSVLVPPSQGEDPSTPPGLEGKRKRRQRESVVTHDSSLSDLHRLPASLTLMDATQEEEDSSSIHSSHHSLAFNTPSSNQTLPLVGSHTLDPYQYRDSVTTEVSTFSDLNILPNALKDSTLEEDEGEDEVEDGPMDFATTPDLPPPPPPPPLHNPATVPARPLPTLLVPPPPWPRRHRPLPPLPLDTLFPTDPDPLRVVPSPEREKESKERAGGAEEIIDPGASSDSLVSPIVFAPIRADETEDEAEGEAERERVETRAPFWLVTGVATDLSSNSNSNSNSRPCTAGTSTSVVSTALTSSTSGSIIASTSAHHPARAPRNRSAPGTPAFGDLLWGNSSPLTLHPRRSQNKKMMMKKKKKQAGSLDTCTMFEQGRRRRSSSKERLHSASVPECMTASTSTMASPSSPLLLHHPPGSAQGTMFRRLRTASAGVVPTPSASASASVPVPSPASRSSTVRRIRRVSKRGGDLHHPHPRTWIGEWNVDMQDAIRELRILKPR
ncbi:hypothetical protein APHAL10511_000309 [Amanita phalloides]|nr:hypothetical protein APHAL10511_000309 [Amanita phalloides]